MLDPIGWVRVLNLALCLIPLAVACLPSSWRWMVGQPYPVRAGGLAIVLMVAATAWGTWHALAHHVPGGMHVTTFLAGLVVADVAAIALVVSTHRRIPHADSSR